MPIIAEHLSCSRFWEMDSSAGLTKRHHMAAGLFDVSKHQDETVTMLRSAGNEIAVNASDTVASERSARHERR